MINELISCDQESNGSCHNFALQEDKIIVKTRICSRTYSNVDSPQQLDCMNFSYLLSSVSATSKSSSEVKNASQNIRKCDRQLYWAILQKINESLARTGDDNCRLAIDYFIVPKKAVDSLNGRDLLKNLSSEINQLMRVRERLDISIAGRTIFEMLQSGSFVLFENKLNVLIRSIAESPQQLIKTEESLLHSDKDSHHDSSRRVNDVNSNVLNLNELFSEERTTREGTEAVLRRFVSAYRSNGNLRFPSLQVDVTTFPMLSILLDIENRIEKNTSGNISEMIINYFTMLDAIITIKEDGIYAVQKLLPDIRRIYRKLNIAGIQDNKDVVSVISNIERRVCEAYRQRIAPDFNEEPPENFRTLSIVPKQEDVVDCPTPYLRKNVISGPYKDLEHYLDVHFRLTREDMLQPFRKCIMACRDLLTICDRKFDSGRLFTNVTVKYPPIYTLEGIAYSVSVKGVTAGWFSYKSLLPGSLICLSCDRFVTLTFGTIQGKTTVSDTEVLIKVLLEHRGEELSHKMWYTLLETDAYFEPYRHVLQCLKDIKAEQFTFEKFLVYLNFDECNTEHAFNANFAFKLKSGENNKIEPKIIEAINIFDINFWPSASELGLDDNQRAAFHFALTKKLALVQGPPGTGKSRLACKIVEVLLANGAKKPIFISCSSNRCLDKFLMQVLHYTKKIIRIGSQSRSEVLQPHALTNLLSAMRIKAIYRDRAHKIMDTIQQKALSVFEDIYPGIQTISTITNDSSSRYVMFKLCNSLNEIQKTYMECKNNYLDDSSLKQIINLEYREKITAGAGSNRCVLRNCVIEWLALYKSATDVYEQCDEVWKSLNSNLYEDDEDADNSEANIWRIPLRKRFLMFFQWRNDYLKFLRREIREKRERYFTFFRKLKRQINGKTIDLLKNAEVIGMTTSGAAKYHDLLEAATPSVLIIEEAAEVYESHVIAALLPSVQHVVLIGDHEQLRPINSSPELNKNYNLNVSMFERLMNNNAPTVRLTKQYRMRPDNARLLVPYFYQSLESDATVELYEDIVGVVHNMYFFSHKEYESGLMLSHVYSNDYEAKLIVKLCQYLLAQGYKQSQITILTTYCGQIAAIWKHIDFDVDELKICTLDSYQGEENDIVLISFVRSNIYGEIGFLAQSDRICVSLSRAKKGLFCIGNFFMFAKKNKLWACLVKRLEANKQIGDTFPIRCRRHKKNVFYVKEPDDFNTLLQTGCGAKCNILLPCGHRCLKTCHFKDYLHDNYKCEFRCEKSKSVEGVITRCPKLCWELCDENQMDLVTLPCGHKIKYENVNPEKEKPNTCTADCEKLLPCGHVTVVPCYKSQEPLTQPCLTLVKTFLECGHEKLLPCSESSNTEQPMRCNVLCTKLSPCGHMVSVPCADLEDNDRVLSCCKSVCNSPLYCGHLCTGPCKSCYLLKIHEICIHPCPLKLPCGHVCQGLCSMPCPPCEKACDMQCTHSKCPNRCIRPCVKCLKPCERSCKHKVCNKQCWEVCSPCKKPCSRTLKKCGHPCIGMCGDPCPDVCNICDKDTSSLKDGQSVLRVRLEDCGHITEVEKMSSYIDEAIDSWEWPSCLQCQTPITKSIRFDVQIKTAREALLKYTDTQDEIYIVKDLIESIFHEDNVIPVEYFHIYRTIRQFLFDEKLSLNYLHVLINILKSLQRLKGVAEVVKQKTLLFKSLYNELLHWIVEHLFRATYQQLEELDSVVDQLVLHAQ